MKANLRQRNVALNSYMSILAITVVAGFATLYIVHVAIDVPFTAFASPSAYDIGVSL
jgi:hypothetical protein